MSKSSLVCAAIGDLEDHHRQFHPGQSNDLGIVGDEQFVVKSFDNSWNGTISMTKWMCSVGVQTAVMESTSSYWCAAHAAMEQQNIKVVLANARHVKNVSVHKTDLKDCVWLAVLLRAGFIAPSYIPVGLIKDLRYAARMRTIITKEITRLKNRCHRILDSVLVNLGLSVVFGRYGRDALLRALQGEYDGLTEEQQLAFDSITKVEGLIIQDLLLAIEMNEERVKRYDVILGTIVERLEVEKGDRDVSLLATVP